MPAETTRASVCLSAAQLLNIDITNYHDIFYQSHLVRIGLLDLKTNNPTEPPLPIDVHFDKICKSLTH